MVMDIPVWFDYIVWNCSNPHNPVSKCLREDAPEVLRKHMGENPSDDIFRL